MVRCNRLFDGVILAWGHSPTTVELAADEAAGGSQQSWTATWRHV
jgi:uncharacterized phage-associated protein